MHQGITHKEAVRLAKERLGEAPAAEVAAFVEATFGLKLQPAIVAVLLASLRERESLQDSKARAMATIEQARAEQKPRRKRQPDGQAGEGGR